MNQMSRVQSPPRAGNIVSDGVLGYEFESRVVY